MGETTEQSDAVAGGTQQPEPTGRAKRRYPRYECLLPLDVRVLVEEATFTPMTFSANARDISAGGMLIDIPELPEETYRELIRSQRFVRIRAQLPDQKDGCVFFGKIVWYDYRTIGPTPTCRMGVAFERLLEKEQKTLSELLRGLEKMSQTTSGPLA